MTALGGGPARPRVEALPQAVAERAVELAVSALDVKALLDRVDLNVFAAHIPPRPARLTGCRPRQRHDCAGGRCRALRPPVIQEGLQGKCAGFASRFTAFAVDVGVSLGVFMLALAAISFAARVLTGNDIA